MAGQALRSSASLARDPVVHDLSPVRFEGTLVTVHLSIRRAEDGMWRGRLRFTDSTTQLVHESAEIVCGASEQDLWQSVRDLRDHHFRDLYRSLA
ncbi:MAG: hypothetical protein ABJD11_02710 [Gemmatimonadota bacterium]